MTVQNEKLPHDGGFLISELGTFSREIITIASGQNLQAGAVIGKIGSSGADADHYKAYDGSASDDTDAAAGILYGNVDATDAAAEGVGIVRGPCEVHEGRLVWGSNQDANEITAGKADLAALDIVLR